MTGLGLAFVDALRAESGLALLLPDDMDDSGLETFGLSVLGLGVPGDPLAEREALPCRSSKYSCGEGFHDVRWKLFFLRTLALYAARIAVVASCVLMKSDEECEPADAMLGAGDFVISRRGSWVVEVIGLSKDGSDWRGSSSRVKWRGDGDVEEHVW